MLSFLVNSFLVRSLWQETKISIYRQSFRSKFFDFFGKYLKMRVKFGIMIIILLWRPMSTNSFRLFTISVYSIEWHNWIKPLGYPSGGPSLVIAYEEKSTIFFLFFCIVNMPNKCILLRNTIHWIFFMYHIEGILSANNPRLLIISLDGNEKILFLWYLSLYLSKRISPWLFE